MIDTITDEDLDLMKTFTGFEINGYVLHNNVKLLVNKITMMDEQHYADVFENQPMNEINKVLKEVLNNPEHTIIDDLMNSITIFSYFAINKFSVKNSSDLDIWFQFIKYEVADLVYQSAREFLLSFQIDKLSKYNKQLLKKIKNNTNLPNVGLISSNNSHLIGH